MSEFEKEAITRLQNGESILGTNGIFTEMLQNIINKALDGEMNVHMSQENPEGKKNRRNGYGKKVVKSDIGELEIQPPRDRDGSFDPQLIKKRERKLGSGVDGLILSLYSKGNSNSDISRLLHEIYGINYSRMAISFITEQVWEEVLLWQQRWKKTQFILHSLQNLII